jgi:hypothetical protein
VPTGEGIEEGPPLWPYAMLAALLVSGLGVGAWRVSRR